MSDDPTGLLITLPARAENVAVVRHAVAGLAEQLGMEEIGVGDLKTVVTEACMNVVVHAYDDGPGPLQIQATPEERGLTVAVRDFGAGIRPRPDVERPSLRIGLTLIAALSSSFEISGGLNRGTEIRMHIPFAAEDRAVAGAKPEFEISDAAKLTIGDPELIAPVLGRVIGALAARRQITVDRLSDAALLTDAISERAPDAFTGGHFSFSVSDQAEGIDLRVGPVTAGASEALLKGLAVPEVGGSLETLADEIRVERGDGGEYLLIRFATVAG
ncbi:MAG TPA: ATP-binding protein [Solirubrobacterales bacterium]